MINGMFELGEKDVSKISAYQERGEAVLLTRSRLENKL